jgi:hypothetical protein
VVSRIGGRLVTGPLAFFLAGAIDVALMLVVYARWRAAQRRTARRAAREPATRSS